MENDGKKLECSSHALVDKRQFGVVAHWRLCASALLRLGRMFPVSSLCAQLVHAP